MTTNDIDAIRPATDLMILRLRETVAEQRGHEHPTSGPDLYCLNLTSFLGERMGAVLRRVADEQAETQSWKDRHTALADEFTVEAQRLQGEIAALTAELEKVRGQLTAANHRADGLTADHRTIGRGALIGYRDQNHRHNDRAPGWCICGDDWDDEGCTEYVGLTEAAQLFPAEVER